MAAVTDLRSPLAELLRGGALRPVFQPIVDLGTGEVAGYEALARGPAGSPLESPAAMFSAAREAGRLAELDSACRSAALAAARTADLRAPSSLWLNVEPEAVDDWRGAALPTAGPRLVLEVTERELALKPAELLEAVMTLRRQGAAIALDDVGADPRSLALLPFVAPEVVKLDMHLVRTEPTEEILRGLGTIHAWAARAGARILAEGLETPEHLEQARRLGATLGQGWLFGRPAPLPAAPPLPARRAVALLRRRLDEERGTPFEIGERDSRPEVGTKRELFAISRGLERHAESLSDPAVVLVCFQSARRFTPTMATRYRALAARAAFVGVFGTGLGREPVTGVRGADLRENERLAGEWNVCVVGAGESRALLARDLGDDGPDVERRFAYLVTEDPEVVLPAARSLMRRIAAGAPTSAGPGPTPPEA